MTASLPHQNLFLVVTQAMKATNDPMQLHKIELDLFTVLIERPIVAYCAFSNLLS